MDRGADDYDADVKEIVNTVREEEGMKEVHSTRSLAALVEQRKEVMENMSPITENGEKALEKPKIITHTDDGGSRMAEKNNVHKLPYMNRNPSV